MDYVGSILLVLTSALINSVYSHSTCNPADTTCVTKGAQKLLNRVVKGYEGFFEPLDPLNLPDVYSKYKDVNYKKINSTIKGISNCVFELLKLNTKDSTGHGEISCPKLYIKYYYEVKGTFGPIETDGAGVSYLNLSDYFITLDGTYRLYTSEKDSKLHLTFLKYKPRFEPKGPMTLDIDGPIHSDPVKDAYAREYVTKTGLYDIEKNIRAVLMPGYVDLVMNAINIYLNEVPFEEIFQE